MKTMILYNSKHGTCKDIAELLQDDTMDVCDMNNFQGNLSTYSVIVLGASIYASQLPKSFLNFIEKHHEVLMKSTLYLFLSGINRDEETLQSVYQHQIPGDIMQHITYCDQLGGKINFPDYNVFEKIIMKMVNKKGHFFPSSQVGQCIDLLDYEKIKKFRLQM